MPTEPDLLVVLVHSPLVGPLTWQPVADELGRQGVTVVVPTLDNPDPADRDPDDRDPGVPLYLHHAERVRRAVESHSRTAPVVLVGHSGAGPILPAIGETLVNEVVRYVFVDSDVPRDRMRRLDSAPPDFRAKLESLAGGDVLPPWSDWWQEDVLATLLPDEEVRERFTAELRPLPVRLFDEVVPLPPEWPDAPCVYVRLSAAYDDAAAVARRLGWVVRRVDAGHLHMLADPPFVARVLVDVVGDTPADPVLATRAKVNRGVDVMRRLGFGALALAVLTFMVALYWDLPSALVALTVACLAVATVTLLPAIILGYGVAAAEREDRERGV